MISIENEITYDDVNLHRLLNLNSAYNYYVYE